MSDHYLNVNDKLMWNGQLCKVVNVGDCNATIRPVEARPKTVVDQRTGKEKPGRETITDVLVSNVTSETLIVH